MRAKYLILAIALLCLLALPSTALAADDNDGAQDRHERHDGPRRHGRRRGRSRHRVHGARGRAASCDDAVPAGVETTDLAGLRRRRRVSDGRRRSTRSPRATSVDLIVADNPVFGFDYASSLDITNLAIGLDKVEAPAAGGPTGAGVGVAVLDSGVATTSDLGSSRIVGWKDFVNKQEGAVRRRRSRHVRRRPHRRRRHRLPAARPGRLRDSAVPRRRAGSRTSSASRSSTPPARVAPPRSWPACCGPSPTRTSTTSACSTSRSAATPSRRPSSTRSPRQSSSPGRTGSRSSAPPATRASSAPAASSSPGNSPYVITVGATDTRQTTRPATTRHLLQLGRPDALGRVRQARPRGSRQPADLAARQGFVHRRQLTRRT